MTRAKLKRRRNWRVPVMVALLTLTLLVGLYLFASLILQMATAWAEQPRSESLAVAPLRTPHATRPIIRPATATRIPRRTATPAPPEATPAAAGPALCYEALRDGGFEEGNGWSMVSTAYTAAYVSRPGAYVTNPVRSGERALRLGISEAPDVFSYSAAEQAVTIPADVTSARLSLWVYLVTADRAGDGQHLLLLKEGGGYDVLMWELSNTPGWERREYSLDAYRGQRMVVHFEVHNDGDGALTAMYVDDVSLTLCRKATP